MTKFAAFAPECYASYGFNQNSGRGRGCSGHGLNRPVGFILQMVRSRLRDSNVGWFHL